MNQRIAETQDREASVQPEVIKEFREAQAEFGKIAEPLDKLRSIARTGFVWLLIRKPPGYVEPEMVAQNSLSVPG